MSPIRSLDLQPQFSISPSLGHRGNDGLRNRHVGFPPEPDLRNQSLLFLSRGLSRQESRSAGTWRQQHDPNVEMVVLCQESRYTGFFFDGCGRKVKVDGESEKGVLLSARDEALTTWAGVIPIQSGQVDVRRVYSQSVWLLRRRDGKGGWIGVTPVRDVGWESGIVGEGENIRCRMVDKWPKA